MGKIIVCHGKFLEGSFKPPNLDSNGWLGDIGERWGRIWGLTRRWGIGTFDKMCKFQISMLLKEKNETAIKRSSQ